MRPRAWWLLSFTIAALEAAALHSLLSENHGAAATMLLHLTACALALAAVRLTVPRERLGDRALMLLSPLPLLLPLVGPMGALLLSRRPTSPACGAAPLVRTFALMALEPVPPRAGRVLDRGGLGTILRHEPSLARRLQAVMDTRRLKARDAVDILRIALRDPVDDVRLLAYALLDRREQGIQQRIQAARSALGAPSHRPGLHRELAAAHFELVHLGLCAGEARELVLRAACRHAEEHLRQRPDDGGAHLLLGRVRLLLGEPRAARESLGRAAASGVAEVKLLPYLAEAAFQEGRLGEVRALMRRLPPLSCRAMPTLDEMRRYWA